jgi:hypothetical protein
VALISILMEGRVLIVGGDGGNSRVFLNRGRVQCVSPRERD